MHKLAEICVRRPVFATMLVVSLTVAGIFSYFGLGVDLLPKVDLPTVIIEVAQPGASPREIESNITEIVEQAVNTISGLEELRSTSVEGLSRVVVTFDLDKDGDVGAQEVRDRVNLITPQLPETAEAPVIQKLDPDASPVLQIVVSGPRSLRDVTVIADKQVTERIENLSGVGQVRMVGGREREISIWIDPDKLQAFNLTVAQVAAALRQQNLELPGGRLDQATRELSVRTLGRVTDPSDFNHLVIATRGGYPVKIQDIGSAEDGAEETRSASYLNQDPAVTLVVSKQSGENTVEVARAIRERVQEVKAALPQDIRLEIVADQSVFIEASVDSIRRHLIEGSILACLVIFIFLANFRTTLIAATAIPISIISTFALMAAMDYTLNQITMLALTLMVGIVIDDAIIVLENIYRFVEEKGMAPVQAAILGTKEIGLAVMATTLSLLAVFVPVGFMGGIVGRFMSSFGLTASFAIAVSTFVSFTLTPMLTSRWVKPARKGTEQERPASKQSWVFRPIDRAYTRLLEWSMAHRKTVVALCGLVVLSTVPLFWAIGINFAPEDDRSEYQVAIVTPEGSTLAATASVAKRLAGEIRELPGVRYTLSSIGGDSTGGVNSASIYVNLKEQAERSLSQQQLMVQTREVVRRLVPDLRSSVQAVGGVGGGGRNAGIQYVIGGPSLDRLDQYSQRLMAKLRELPDATDVDSSLVAGKPEVRLEIDRARAADLGIQAGDIAQALNMLVAGQTVTTFTSGSEQIDVRLRAAQEFRTSPSMLNRIVVGSGREGPVTLDQVVRIEQGVGPSAIERLNRQRQVTVYANLVPGGSQAEVLAELDEEVAGMNLPSGYQAQLAGISKELDRTGYYFLLAFALSFIFMYIVLAAQFESFIHPVTILLTLPLAVPFGILSLLVMGQSMNIFSGLGLLLLFGIVKKNAILQIDHMNTLRAQGVARYRAIIQANRDRLRPILMTTIALVAGMMPLVVSSGPGAATNRSIGVLVVGGQTLCLLLTLLAVPVFYSLFDDAASHPIWRTSKARLKGWAESLGRILPRRRSA